MPSLRPLLSASTDLIAAMVNIPHPAIVEIFGQAGFDVVIVDTEHGAIDRAAMNDLVRAGDAAGVPVLVRVPHRAAFDWIEAALDAGAAGVVVPRVESAAQVRDVLSASKYPPAGTRGSGPGRASRYGLKIEEQLKSANADTVFAIMLETEGAVADIGEIAAIPGLDLVLIGPNDLGIALRSGQSAHSVRSASAAIARACAGRGVASGTFCMSPDDLAVERALGMRVFVTGSDIFALIRTAHDVVARSRS